MADFARLQGRVGEIILPDSEGYDEARHKRIWNQRLAASKHPAAIITVRDAAEARAAILFARDNGMKLTVRGHGHNYEAASLRDGAIMLDIGPMSGLDIDYRTRTAWAGAALSGGYLIDDLEPLRLGFPIGHCSHVALSGYVLSGGFGWNAGEWGPASANVLAIEVVTASGEHLCVDEDNHPDLFWAARGAGSGFFAAALRYKLKLHDLPATAFTWSSTFTSESAPALADWLTAATAAADPAAEIICLVGPDHHSGRPAVIVRASATGEDAEQARAKVAEFRDPPSQAEIIEGPQGEVLELGELTKLSAMPNGKRVYADQLWSDGSMGDMLVAVYHLADVPVKSSSINLMSFGGGAPIAHCDGATSALSIGGGAEAGIYAMWDDPADDERHFKWVRDADAALARFRIGRYIGEANLRAGPGRVEQCFAPGVLERIERLRTEWDPDGLFCSFPAE